jgi:YD repeat-containing protein
MAEIEAYDSNTNKLASTAFGAVPVFAAGNEPDKVNDGDIVTEYKYKYGRTGYVGIDLGSAQTLSKMRFYPKSTMNTYGRFYLMSDLPSTIPVIASVSTSDGRSVTYEYTLFEDTNMPVNYQMLTGALYSDGTRSTYTYDQVWPGVRPLMARAVDPRRGGAGADISYGYNNPSGIYGVIENEKLVSGGTTNQVIAVSKPGGYSTKIDYPNGRSILRSNQPDGMLLSETDGLGRVRKYTWTTNNFLRTAIDPLGRTNTFDTSVYGNILTNTASDGTKRIWTRDARERVLSYTDERGKVTSHIRDGQGRIIRTDHPDGAYELYTHNSFGQPLTHTMKNGAVESWTYSATGLKESHTDALGNVTYYGYDAADRLCCVTDPLGRTTTWTFNERGQITQVQNPDGSTRSMTYDLFGNKLTETDELGHVTTWTYDEYNRMLTQTDPLGHTTTYEYGAPSGGAGSCACNTGNHPTRITDPNGNVTINTYNLEWQLISTTDPEGNTTSWTYDLAGNRKTQTDARGNT